MSKACDVCGKPFEAFESSQPIGLKHRGRPIDLCPEHLKDWKKTVKAWKKKHGLKENERM